ncbi:MAG: IPT/TIG domain-containing protein, partial [Prevotellaceae bacterium]|nr:IPT/TIG domain-containing protein [Prevotellaceae bacterium]
MNKLSKISVLVAAIIAIMLVSCNPEEPEISITITSVAPTKVVAGDVITVTGTHFDKITEAAFGTVKVAKTAITFVSSEEIKLAV